MRLKKRRSTFVDPFEFSDEVNERCCIFPPGQSAEPMLELADSKGIDLLSKMFWCIPSGVLWFRIHVTVSGQQRDSYKEDVWIGNILGTANALCFPNTLSNVR